MVELAKRFEIHPVQITINHLVLSNTCPNELDDIHLTPADVYFNRGDKILKEREVIKQKTIIQRRINHLLQNHNQSLSFV
jgi:hypothetical protein